MSRKKPQRSHPVEPIWGPKGTMLNVSVYKTHRRRISKICVYCRRAFTTSSYEAGVYLGYPSAFYHSQRKVPVEVAPACTFRTPDPLRKGPMST